MCNDDDILVHNIIIAKYDYSVHIIIGNQTDLMTTNNNSHSNHDNNNDKQNVIVEKDLKQKI